MSEIVLQTEDLSFVYPDGNEALHGVGFQVERGMKLFFHGANGAGKTTLFQCLNGLLKIKRGTVRIHGEIVRKESERMKRVGIVFQNAADQIISGSVFDELAFGPLNQGLLQKMVIERVEAALRLLNIEHLRNRPPHFLSYGEKKRVAIASVLSMDQDIVLLDEPTLGLDARQQEELVGVLNRLANEGRTLLIATHNADFSFCCADRIIVLDQGRIICNGKAEEVFSQSDVLKKTGMGKPILFQVYEQLVRNSYLEQGFAPKTMSELSELLHRKTR